MLGWDDWKKGFDAWEGATARWFEEWMQSPLVLEPAGAVLTAFMRGKAHGDRTMAVLWGSMGLPTKRDQERALHLLNQLQSRLLDLEEQLADAKSRQPG